MHIILLTCKLLIGLLFYTLLLYHRHIINIKYRCSTAHAVNFRRELVLENAWVSISKDCGNPGMDEST